jgi:hypothetical protein
MSGKALEGSQVRQFSFGPVSGHFLQAYKLVCKVLESIQADALQCVVVIKSLALAILLGSSGQRIRFHDCGATPIGALRANSETADRNRATN